jgi:hypothetical protein
MDGSSRSTFRWNSGQQLSPLQPAPLSSCFPHTRPTPRSSPLTRHSSLIRPGLSTCAVWAAWQHSHTASSPLPTATSQARVCPHGTRSSPKPQPHRESPSPNCCLSTTPPLRLNRPTITRPTLRHSRVQQRPKLVDSSLGRTTGVPPPFTDSTNPTLRFRIAPRSWVRTGDDALVCACVHEANSVLHVSCCEVDMRGVVESESSSPQPTRAPPPATDVLAH